MKRLSTALAVLSALSAVHAQNGNAAGATVPPNVVFILADDLGWSDTTLYGNTKFYKTPNLERLRKRGMLYTRAYAASPLCSPTRASLMTGLNPARVGITAPSGHVPQVKLKETVNARAPAYMKATLCTSATRLDTTYYTLAKAFKAAGYATGHFGKWHLGAEPYSPLQQGFDVDLPHWWGPSPAGSYLAPWKFPAKLNFLPRTPNEHIEDRMAFEAVKWMKENGSVALMADEAPKANGAATAVWRKVLRCMVSRFPR